MFTVWIIGRTNVGKSTLVNALLGYSRSIVFDEPGTTRDVVSDVVDWGKGAIRVCDTQGIFGEADLKWLDSQIPKPAILSARPSEKPSEASSKDASVVPSEKASVILFVVDATSGVTPFDEMIGELVRRSGLRALMVVNKIDVPSGEGASAFSSLGMDDSVEVSAVHRRGSAGIREWVLNVQQGGDTTAVKPAIRLAIIGRPNTGKSTLLNRLAREKVSLVSPQPLTTRDPVFCDRIVKGQLVRLIDTAGLRRPRSRMERIEEFSVKSTTETIDRAEVVFLLIDSREGLTDQDMRILGLLERRHKPSAILYNFWDRLSRPEQRTVWENRTAAVQNFETMPISGKTGYNLNRLLPLGVDLSERGGERIPTGKFNSIIRSIIDKNPPPSRGRGNFNILYAIQASARPPTFVFFMNRKENFPGNYKSYLENELRSAFGYKSQPIRLLFRAKSGGQSRSAN